MANLLKVHLFQENVNNCDSNASFLITDLEEINYRKIGSGNMEKEEQQLVFVGSHFWQDFDPYTLDESLISLGLLWECLSDLIHSFLDLKIVQKIEVNLPFKLS